MKHSVETAVAQALVYYLAQALQGHQSRRHFFRLDGFDTETYQAFVQQIEQRNHILANFELVVRTVRALDGLERYAIEETRSATWYRNNLADQRALVLIFNRRTTDAQSVKDLFPVTESTLAHDGLPQLIRACFTRYQLASEERTTLRTFVQRLNRVLFEPQLRDLVSFFLDVDNDLAAEEGLTLAEAIARCLPQLGLFRCRALVPVLNTPRGDKLLRNVYQAARIGQEILDERTRNQYLDRLEKARQNGDLVDERDFKGFSVDEKARFLHDFITTTNTDRTALLRVLRIDWDEIRAVLYRRTRLSEHEKLQATAEAIQQTLAQSGMDVEALDQEAQSLLTNLQQGVMPDADALEQFVEEYQGTLDKKVRNQLTRLIELRTLATHDFLMGVVSLAIELLTPHQEELTPGTQLRVAFRQPSKLNAAEEEAILAFQTLYGGITQVVPMVQWQLESLWAAVFQPTITEETDEAADEQEFTTKTDLSFRVTLVDGEGNDLSRADLVWQYRSDSPAAATVANLRAEARRIDVTQSPAVLAIPLYNTCPDPGDVGDLDLRRPRKSLGQWYCGAGNLRDQLATSGNLHAKQSWPQIDSALTTLEQQWATFVSIAVEDGMYSAPTLPLLAAYEGLLDATSTNWRRDREARDGYRLLNQAWIVGEAHFVRWAVLPLLHPLKQLWWRERARYFNVVIARLLDPEQDVSIVDQRRFQKELPATYGSATFPAVLALPDHTGKVELFVPIEEADGYELFYSEHQSTESYGQDATLLALEDTDAEARRTTDALVTVVQDYIETYPFVRDGLEIYLFQCRNSALPGLLVDQLLKMASQRGWQVRLSVIVHTEDRGAPLFQRISAWAHEEHPQAERVGREYFPPVTLKVLECSTDELFERIEDTDIVILTNVLAEQGQKVASDRDDRDEPDSHAEGYLPVYRAQQKPFERGELRRSIRLNPAPQPRAVRLFYNVQAAAHRERATRPTDQAIFNRELTLTAWEHTLTRLHNTFNWVVCYDTTVDRFLMEETFPETVQVIRYSMGLGAKRQHNLTVSSSDRSQKVVMRRLTSQLGSLLAGSPDGYRQRVAEQLIDQAKELSGDIVLRAAGPGTFLNELIGLVLAKFQTEYIYRQHHPDTLTAWIFLDDFQHWFRKKMPDLLFVALRTDEEERLVIDAQVIEAKCVGQAAFDRESTDAQQQVVQGVSRLATAFAPDADHLDGLFWQDQFYRAVVGNLVLDPHQHDVWDTYADAFRTGDYTLMMSGQSWVFCYDGQTTATLSNQRAEGLLNTRAPNAPACPLYYHHIGRSGLRAVLRDLLKATGKLEELTALWELRADETQEPLPLVSEPVSLAPSGEDEEEIGKEYHDDTVAEQQVSMSLESPPAAPAEQVATTPATPVPTTSEEKSPPNEPSDTDREWRQQRARELERALRQYNIQMYSIDPDSADIGPSIVRFKVRLRPGETINRMQRVADDLARELALTGPPLIDNVPGTHFVGIDLPRPAPEVVDLLPLMHHLKPPQSGALPVIIGQSPAGDIVIDDLAEFPHLLVAGATNSGKSVFLRSLLLCLMQQYRPGALELLIIDPKQTDFSFFDNLPYLRGGSVLTDRNAAKEALLELVNHEMPRRQQLMRGRSLKIKEFNQRYPDEALPPIVAMIDEYAQLISIMPKKDADAFEQDLMSLAAVARSTGIHLILATQRPSADVVTGVLRANLDSRIAFKVASATNSRIVLDQGGAENLLGRGDMLFRRPSGQILRLQGTFIGEVEIQEYLAKIVKT